MPQPVRASLVCPQARALTPGGLISWHYGRTPGAPSLVGSLHGTWPHPDPHPLSTRLDTLLVTILGPVGPWVKPGHRESPGSVSVTMGCRTLHALWNWNQKHMGRGHVEGDAPGGLQHMRNDVPGWTELGSVVSPLGPPLPGDQPLGGQRVQRG